MPWCEALYRNDGMPSLESIDTVHTEGEHEHGYWESPGSQYCIGVLSVTTVGAFVRGSALSTWKVPFPPVVAVKGSMLGFPERLSGTSSS